jgi:hypothetical protein
MVDGVLLRPEQEDLLVTLVEAERKLPRGEREQFMFFPTLADPGLAHPGLPGREIPVYVGDLDALSSAGLLHETWTRSGARLFDITPAGLAAYEAIKKRSGAPVEQLEEDMRHYLDAEVFQKRYPRAYRKWAEAAEKLWSSDSEEQLNTVGHLCREAIQEFAAALVERYKPPEVSLDKAHDINRIQAVLDQNAARLGTRVSEFLEALLNYWRTVSRLVQRQVHGSQKEDRPLVLEDGRRVVFHTAVVMYEVDRALER